MSAKFPVLFVVVSGSFYFVTVILFILDQKMHFSASSQTSITEQPFFWPFDVFFSKYVFFHGGVIDSCLYT